MSICHQNDLIHHILVLTSFHMSRWHDKLVTMIRHHHGSPKFVTFMRQQYPSLIFVTNIRHQCESLLINVYLIWKIIFTIWHWDDVLLRESRNFLNHGHNKIRFGLSLPKIKINWSSFPYFSYDVPLLLFLAMTLNGHWMFSATRMNESYCNWAKCH